MIELKGSDRKAYSLPLLAALLMATSAAGVYAQPSVPPAASLPVTGPHEVGSRDSSPPPVLVSRNPVADTSFQRNGEPSPETPPDSVSTMQTVPLDSAAEESHPRLRPEEYTFAGSQRFTLNGDLPYRETNLHTGTVVAFGGTLLGLATAITWYQQAWYPDSTKSAFHFQTDWGYSKQFDKAGHMFGGWMSSYCSYEAFIASGMSKEDAALWGSIGGLFFQTFMEVQDGFHTYGFDPTDQLSNTIGAGYFYLQQRVPFFQNIDPKWSVGPTHRDSAREASQIRSRIVLDDYDRQNVWLSLKVHNLLPESLKSYWPKWLQIAVGAGARDVELTGYSPYRVVHISLDYNLQELLPDMGSFGNWLIQGLNAFHLPAPALQIWPEVKFQLLYPFTL